MAKPPPGGGRWLRPKQVVDRYPIKMTKLFDLMRLKIIERVHDGKRITYVSEDSVIAYFANLPRDKKEGE